MDDSFESRQQDLGAMVAEKWLQENTNRRLHLEQYGEKLHDLMLSRLRKHSQQVASGEIEPKAIRTESLDIFFFPPDSTDAKLLFRDADGITDVELGASSSGRAYLNLGTQQQAFAEYHIFLDTGGPDLGPMLTLGNIFSNPAANVMLSAGKFNSISVYGSAGRFFVGTDENSGGPSVTVEDKEGYSGVLGRTNLETIGTGRKTQTPAASLVLFGRDENVLCTVIAEGKEHVCHSFLAGFFFKLPPAC